MYAAMRRYRITPTVSDELIREIFESFVPALKEVPGFLAYYVLEAGESGIATVSVFDSQSGVEASGELAREWIKRYLSTFILSQEEVSEFSVKVEESLRGRFHKEACDALEESQAAAGEGGSRPSLLTVEEACEELGMGKAWVYRKIKSGEIPSIKLGRSVKIRSSDLEEYLESRRSQPLARASS